MSEDSVLGIRAHCVNAMETVFGADCRRIQHAYSVLRYAEKILGMEAADERIVVAAAILHDIGIHEAERKYGSSAGQYQEIEGPSIARRILARTSLSSKETEHVCEIIANHHSARSIDTQEFRILWDADWLVNLPEETDLSDFDKVKGMIEKVFKTKSGAMIAREMFLDTI